MPFCSNFASPPVPTNGAVLQGVASGLAINGSGTIELMLLLPNGQSTMFHFMAYYVPKANQCLLSPQHILQHQTPNVAGLTGHFMIRSDAMEYIYRKQ